MSGRLYSGLFVAEGSSDIPLASIIQDLFLERGVSVRLSQPDYSLIPEKVKKDIASRLIAGTRAMRPGPDLIVVHRDSDNGNPRGKMDLCLPKPHEVEFRSDPKKILAEVLLRAADATGRRRKDFEKRFSSHRRQLLERLDPLGPIVRLSSWQALIADIEAIVARWQS